MSEEIPYAYQLRHHEQEVERLGTEIDRQRVEIAKLKEMLNEAADTLIDNDDYTVQALNSIGHDLKREAAK